MPIIPLSTTVVTLAVANAARTALTIRNMSNAVLTTVLPEVIVIPVGQSITIYGNDAQAAFTGAWADVLGVTEVGSALIEEDTGPNDLSHYVRYSSIRLTANDRETKWGMLLDLDNGSGLWSHPAGTATHANLIDSQFVLDRGVASASETSGNTFVVSEINAETGKMGGVFLFGIRTLEGQTQKDDLAREIDTQISGGRFSCIDSTGYIAATDSNAPDIPDTFASPYGDMPGSAIGVGDHLSFLRNGGGDRDVWTHRIWYRLID